MGDALTDMPQLRSDPILYSPESPTFEDIFLSQSLDLSHNQIYQPDINEMVLPPASSSVASDTPSISSAESNGPASNEVHMTAWIDEQLFYSANSIKQTDKGHIAIAKGNAKLKTCKFKIPLGIQIYGEGTFDIMTAEGVVRLVEYNRENEPTEIFHKTIKTKVDIVSKHPIYGKSNIELTADKISLKRLKLDHKLELEVTVRYGQGFYKGVAESPSFRLYGEKETSRTGKEPQKSGRKRNSESALSDLNEGSSKKLKLSSNESTEDHSSDGNLDETHMEIISMEKTSQNRECFNLGGTRLDQFYSDRNGFTDEFLIHQFAGRPESVDGETHKLLCALEISNPGNLKSALEKFCGKYTCIHTAGFKRSKALLQFVTDHYPDLLLIKNTKDGGNVLHSTCATRNNMEGTRYILENVNHDIAKGLLAMENEFGCRPIEMARFQLNKRKEEHAKCDDEEKDWVSTMLKSRQDLYDYLKQKHEELGISVFRS